MMGVVGGHDITATFDGDASLRKRPMRRILDPLEKFGAKTIDQKEGGRLPITVKGALDPIPVVYEVPVPSAQVKSAVLLAGQWKNAADPAAYRKLGVTSRVALARLASGWAGTADPPDR